MVIDLSSVSRERAMLTTIADAIVASAVGRGLRVGVACPTSHLAFVGHLTRALHARGRSCRYLASKPNPSSATSSLADPVADDPTVMVITSGPLTQLDADVQRINIDVMAGTSTAPTEACSVRQTDDGRSDAEHRPDIIVDYHCPEGPTIRHMTLRPTPPRPCQ